MVKHTQTIRRLLPTNCLSVFDHFVRLALIWLKLEVKNNRLLEQSNNRTNIAFRNMLLETFPRICFADSFNSYSVRMPKIRTRITPNTDPFHAVLDASRHKKA